MTGIALRGSHLQELRELQRYYQDSATGLGFAAQNYDALSLGVTSSFPGSGAVSARQMRTARQMRWVELALHTLPIEHQAVLRDCYAATGAAADDRARRYGAAAGATRAAWRKSERLQAMEAELRTMTGDRRPLRQRRNALQDEIGATALATATAAHQGYVAARAANKRREAEELVADRAAPPERRAEAMKAATGLPNRRAAAAAKVARDVEAMMREMEL